MEAKFNPLLLSTKVRFALAGIIILLIFSCKKIVEGQLEIGNKLTLSKISSDYKARLSAIKKDFFENKIDEKLNPKTNQKIVWNPDWEHPTSQIVNDSISYVFYTLLVDIKTAEHDKLEKIRSNSYLIVKNEKEFFRGIYFADSSITKSSTLNFTGKLLLTNLKTKKSFIIRYANGKPFDNFTKSQRIASAKLMSTPGSLSYWGQNCHQEMKYCVFAPAGYTTCGGTLEVEISPNCIWPNAHCGVSWYLVDSSEETVCEDVWFPDPPTDPGDGGSGGDNSGGDYDDESETDGNVEINGTQDPDFPSNCASWAYTTASVGSYQTSGVTDMRFDFVTEYQGTDGKLHVDYVIYHFDKTLYFEFPKTRLDGTIILPSEAARLTALAKDAAEEILESQVESSPPPASGAPTTLIMNRFLNLLKNQVSAYGGRVTYKNNYGTPSSAVRPYTKGIGGC
ncbi:hypothetical protein ACFOG5_15840 [Pedobacter fastidiosus]|uniref:GLPGLI family protein n=1 Tax=Pedobacter fastidiosus TaxID=2765361 RepID=A0ABR7KQ44_9SPHI|nr:hypothetical protein [Pedobacter fastidiosus]MBC6110208.1 hypothetical protein [Pedobacter fastidiosus]